MPRRTPHQGPTWVHHTVHAAQQQVSGHETSRLHHALFCWSTRTLDVKQLSAVSHMTTSKMHVGLVIPWSVHPTASGSCHDGCCNHVSALYPSCLPSFANDSPSRLYQPTAPSLWASSSLGGMRSPKLSSMATPSRPVRKGVEGERGKGVGAQGTTTPEQRHQETGHCHWWCLHHQEGWLAHQ
jgi:hypothetical protein